MRYRVLGRRPCVPLAGPVGQTKVLGKARSIAVFTIREEHQVVPIGHSLRDIGVQTTDQLLVAFALPMGENQFALWIHDFRFPRWLLLRCTEAIPLIRRQRLDSHILDACFVKETTWLPIT